MFRDINDIESIKLGSLKLGDLTKSSPTTLEAIYT